MTERTYWGGNGRYQELADALTAKVPDEGQVSNPRGANRRLEKFRQASNAYYDIFNNGGGNRGPLIRGIFGISVGAFTTGGRGRFSAPMRTNWDGIHRHTEPRMDEIILDAAVEQGLITTMRRRALDYLTQLRAEAHPDLIDELGYLLAEQKATPVEAAA